MSNAVHEASGALPAEAAVFSFPVLMATLVAIVLLGSTLAGNAAAAENAHSTPELTGDMASDEGPATAYYRWIDGNGRIQYTDFEPVGVPAERIPLDLQADDAPVLSSAVQDQPSDPFYDQDQQILPIEHIGPCADARRQLSILHAALPVYANESGEYRNAWRGDAYKGERVYLDAETRTAAITTVRGAVLEHCSDPEAFAREEAAFNEELGRN